MKNAVITLYYPNGEIERYCKGSAVGGTIIIDFTVSPVNSGTITILVANTMKQPKRIVFSGTWKVEEV